MSLKLKVFAVAAVLPLTVMLVPSQKVAAEDDLLMEAAGAVAEAPEGRRPNGCNDEECPDLIVWPYQWPSTATEGLLNFLHFTTENVGDQVSGFSKTIVFIDGSSSGYDNVPALDPGESRNGFAMWMPTCGTHTVYAKADRYNWVDESNESNNTTSTHTITVNCP